MVRTVLLALALALGAFWVATTDAGNHFDPNGATATSDVGNQLDPNG